MVGKGKAVSGSSAGQSYLEKKEDGKTQKPGFELGRHMLLGETPTAIHREFQDWNKDNPQIERLSKKVFTMVMSPSIEDGDKLDNQELLKMGLEFMHKTLGIDPMSQPWRMYVHTEKAHKHVHIYTPRTDWHGKTINDSFIGYRAQRAADEVAIAHGLTRAKTVVQERTQTLKGALQQIAAQSVSFEDYTQRARKKGIEIKPTINKQGQMQGYKVEYQGNEFKASSIDRKLTAPKLQPLFDRNLVKEKTISRDFGMGR